VKSVKFVTTLALVVAHLVLSQPMPKKNFGALPVAGMSDVPAVCPVSLY
jgi:hypothetical protein